MKKTKEIKENEVSRAPLLRLYRKPALPGSLATLTVSAQSDVQTLMYAIDNGMYFVSFYYGSDDKPLEGRIGTLIKITKHILLPHHSIHVFISAEERVVINSASMEKGIPFADYSVVPDDEKTGFVSAAEEKTYVTILMKYVSSLAESNVFAPNVEVNALNVEDSPTLSNYIGDSLVAPGEFTQEILETTSPKSRIEKLISHLMVREEIVEMENMVREEFFDKVKNENRARVIKEEIRALNAELSGMGRKTSSSDIQQRVADAKLPDAYREALEKELDKISTLDPSNPDYAVSKFYVETVLSLPFSFEDRPPNYNISEVKKVLEEDHYGLRDVKDRILEFLGSRLKAENGKGAIICLVGPPGTGKTSVGHSIARALGKKFYRFSVGGMKDEAEIKGHRRTYVGAMPGKIIQAMTTVGVTDPVILIDEIDKMGSSFRGDPSSALLEALDPEQNTGFRDLYIDLPYDLSNVLFILTANNAAEIPLPLLDRMELITLSGYTSDEKYHIGKNYLVPRLKKKNGLTSKEISFNKNSLLIIAEEYAREAGVRNYEKSLDKIMRKVALEILENDGIELPVKMDLKTVEKYLGKPLFPSDDIITADKCGTAIGLAWTSMGGDALLIEAKAIPRKGELKITGQLGDVMKESAAIAWSVLQSEASVRGMDMEFFENKSVHLHVPEGAVPKDGPSAGITLFTALWSMFTGRTIKKALAMTGELTLTGKVMPIGGLKEKVLAARRNGIKEIIIPKKNLIDLEKLDDDVKGPIVFHPVSDISEVILIAFGDKSKEK